MSNVLIQSILSVTVTAVLISPAPVIALEQERPMRREPPPEAFAACVGKSEGAVVSITTPRNETLSATCRMFNGRLAAAPDRNRREQPQRDDPSSLQGERPPRAETSDGDGSSGRRPDQRGSGLQRGGQQYSINQALSDQAQLHTIAFSGLAFMTGDFGSSTFIPPGKVADFFGFQYMRDIDAAGKGHNPMFLDRIAGSVMTILSDQQRVLFEQAAREQENLVREIALKRLPMIAAFHQTLENSSVLDHQAVIAHGAELFALDARLAYKRAKVFGAVARSLTDQQKQALGRMKFGDFNSWLAVDRDTVRQMRPRGATKLVSVGYMTLASEFFSWYAGSIEADTYFCPERHGTYFGGFYLKDLPAMGQRDYDISTSLTGDSGAAFAALLNSSQRSNLTGVLERQRKTLLEIVKVRRAMATKLRAFLRGDTPSEREVIALGRQYGQLDAELAYEYATAFTAIYKSLSAAQKERLTRLRSHHNREQGTAFIYSDRIRMPEIADARHLLRGK